MKQQPKLTLTYIKTVYRLEAFDKEYYIELENMEEFNDFDQQVYYIDEKGDTTAVTDEDEYDKVMDLFKDLSAKL